MTKEELSDLINWCDEKVRQEHEREKLADLITSYFGVDPAYYGIEVSHFADYLIENGVVIPVRCKDCKHRDEYGTCTPPIISGYGYDHLSPEDNDFCSYGERKDNE